MATAIDRDRVQELVAKGAQLVEVLPAKEFEEDHLPGARSIPLRQINQEVVATLDASRPVIVYCWDQAWDLAPRAAARLETLGFQEVYHYRGGKLDWMASGGLTEGENSKRPRAADVARKDVTTCALDDRLGDVRERALATGLDAAVVVDGQRVVLGFLRAPDLAKDPELTIERAMRPGPSTFRPYVPIKEVADFMDKHNLESSPITTSDGKLVGLLLHSDARQQAEGCPDCVRPLIQTIL